MKSVRHVIPVLILSCIGLGTAGADGTGSPPFSEQKAVVYGYIVDYANANVYSATPEAAASSDSGDVVYVRLKGDFTPQDNLFFHIELAYGAQLGNQNPYIVAPSYGLLTPGTPTSIQSLTVDHAWGATSLGPLDLQFGKIPLGWGTGYVFNPTQRAAFLNVFNPVVDETPGTYALQPTVAITDNLSVTGYLAFQDRTHRETVALQDGAWQNLPFGVKLHGILGSFDLSVSFIKEVVYDTEVSGDYRRSSYIGADTAGAIWNFGVYAEATLRLPTDATGTSWQPSSFHFFDALDAVAGFDYSFSAVELDVRCEYYHQGAGTSDTSKYNVLSVLSGEQPVQGRDYLFGLLTKTLTDYTKLNLGGLVNLNDGSFVLMPEFVWDISGNLELRTGGMIFNGRPGTEFNGEYNLGAGVFDITPDSVHASVKLSF